MANAETEAKKLIKRVQGDVDRMKKLWKRYSKHTSDLYDIERREALDPTKHPTGISEVERKALKKMIDSLLSARSDFSFAMDTEMASRFTHHLEMRKFRDQVKYSMKGSLTPLSDSIVKSLVKDYIALARRQNNKLITEIRKVVAVRNSMVNAIDAPIAFLAAKKTDSQREAKAYIATLRAYRKLASGFDSSKAT